MKTDSLFYRLFQYHPQLALELLGLNYRGDSYRFGSEEIKQTAFRLDGVFTPLNDNSEQPLIFAEVQFQPDDDFMTGCSVKSPYIYGCTNRIMRGKRW